MPSPAEQTRPALPALGPESSLNGAEPMAETAFPEDGQRDGLIAAARAAAAGETALSILHEARDPLAAARAGLAGAARDLPRVGKALKAAMRGLPAAARAVLDDALGQYGAVTVLREVARVLEESAQAVGRAEEALAAMAELGGRAHGAAPDETLLQPNDVVAKAARLAGAMVRERAKLVVDLQPLPLVEADPGALLHVLVEILRNAAQALPAGDPEGNEVVVSTRLERGQALIAIEDSGVGMDGLARRQVCEPFYSGVGRAGLGLYAAADAVARAGGSFEVSSVPGVGTRVEIRLPQPHARGRDEMATGRHPAVAPGEATLSQDIAPPLGPDEALIGGRTLAGPGPARGDG